MSQENATKKKTPRTGGTRRTNKTAPKVAELPAPPMEDFMTRERANAGHQIPLYAADGRLTAHWLQVRGVDSDEFIRARTKQTRRTAEIVALPEEERDAAIVDATLEMHAALVAAWSFDKPCTLANVKAFLREAPQIATEVDKLASRRTFFFKTPSGGLMPSPPPSSP